MPISAPSAGTAAAYAPSANGRGLRLDYHGSDRGPLRVAPRQTAAPAEMSGDAFGAPVAAGPAPAEDASASSPRQIQGGIVYEGADALAALSRDLAGGGMLSLQEAVPPPSAEAAAPAGSPAPETDGAGAPAPEIQTSWRHDDTRGRRLGDRPVPAADESGVETWLFGEDGFGFDDLLDIVNPLQHIPVVSSLYRWITGDEIAPAASVAGGALFGGPIGMAGAMAGVAVEETTGRDLGEHAIAMMFGEDGDPAAADNLASSPAAASPQTATAAELARPMAADTAPARAFGAIPQSSLPAIRAPVAFIPSNIPGSLPAVDRGAGEPPARDTTRQRDDAPAPVDADSIPGQMMDALNKYEALVRARVGTAPSSRPAAGSLYDGTT